MTKTESYANHCEQADDDREIEIRKLVIVAEKPASPPNDWVPEGSSHDVIKRPTKYEIESQMKLIPPMQSTRLKSSTVAQSNRMRSERVQRTMTPRFNPPTPWYSMTDKLLSKVTMTEPLKYLRKTNYSLSDQRTLMAKPKVHARALQTINYISSPLDPNKRIYSLKAPHQESTNTETFPNEGTHTLLFVDESLALQAPKSTIFHQKNDETLQANQELTALEEASSLAESTCNVLSVRHNELIPPPITSTANRPIHLSELVKRDGFAVPVADMPEPFQSDAINSVTVKVPPPQVVPLPLKQPKYSQTVLNAVKPRTSPFTYERSKKLIKLPQSLQVGGSIIRTLPNTLVRINPSQMHPTTSNTGKKAVCHNVSQLKRPIRSEGNTISTATTTTLQGKNKGNTTPVKPSKVRILEVNPVNRICMVGGGVKKSAAGANLSLLSGQKPNMRAVSECLKLLKKNNFNVSKVANTRLRK